MTDEIVSHYTDHQDEDQRLAKGVGPFEYARTKELIRRHVQPDRAVVIDVGGGTGAYSLWLAQAGHDVHFLDLVPHHVQQVGEKATRDGIALASATQGDARTLPFEDEFADMVLVLGPLYHLPFRHDRVQAIREAGRATKRTGCVLCSGISRFAPMLAGFRFRRFTDEGFEATVDSGLRAGVHETATSGDHLGTAFLHRPDELREEMEEAGLTVERIVGIEGPVALVPELEEWVSQKSRMYELALKYSRAVEEEANLLGVSFHLLAVGRRL